MTPGLSFAAITLTLALLWCEQPVPEWDEDVYVWRTKWSEPVLDAVRRASPYVDRFRILSAQWDQDAPPLLVDLEPGREVFRARRIVPVARLDGARISATPEAVAEALASQINVFRKAGAQVEAIEIDHDTTAVADYARWLVELRSELPEDLELWIKALPDWRHASQIEQLLDQVDRYTLQVHAVAGGSSGLMDANEAERWVRAFSKISRTPFYTALPVYQIRAGVDTQAETQSLEAGSAVPAGAASQQWLFAPPQELFEWQMAIELDQPDEAVGIAWYRLPVTGDPDVISMATFQTLLGGGLPEAEIELVLDPVPEESGAFDGTLVNHGPHDDAWPARTALPSGCQVAETTNGFAADHQGEHISHPQAGLLKSGKAIAVGYVRCSKDAHLSE